MNTNDASIENHPSQLTPGLAIADATTAYWFAQVTLRLRREVAWCWYQRAQHTDPGNGVLPPINEAAIENLDLVRHNNSKQEFFNTDPAARYLSDEIAALEQAGIRDSDSRWVWLSQQLGLDEGAQFVLALALASRIDAALGPVFANCMNDLSRPYASLALAQRLWDDPLTIVASADPDHSLFRYGLLAEINRSANASIWLQALSMPAMIAQQLIDPESTLPLGCTPLLTDAHYEPDHAAELLVARLQGDVGHHAQIVPMFGPRGAAYQAWATMLGRQLKRLVVALDVRSNIDQVDILALASVCWLRGLDIVLPDGWVEDDNAKVKVEALLSTRTLPLRWYVPINDYQQQKLFPDDVLTPPLTIPSLSFEQRVAKFKNSLGIQASELTAVIDECARRFRFQDQLIERVSKTFADNNTPLTAENLFMACTNEANVELGHLAQRVTPRFGPDELVLPRLQWQQFQDILHAMRTLTVVHYHWGTARVWNESGLSVLFCGPPGTGKTMTAEVLAQASDLPMFRIDLSQVVNKYIGETEKNLKQIFDAAELSECILFFDEADALFGKRTEVKDAHDRFANIEISYLLERMERFKGLAILATNRRKDLDEAFMRRLRYVIEFPVPGVEERKRIWQHVFPKGIDVSELDFHYLAKQFQLTGGHIRSIAFNACLRAADASESNARAKLAMPDLLMAIKRELEKMNRSAGDELFGSYRGLLKEQVA